MTEEEIEAHRTPNGGFTKAQLAEWGVPWPPPKGWKKALMAKAKPASPFTAKEQELVDKELDRIHKAGYQPLSPAQAQVIRRTFGRLA